MYKSAERNMNGRHSILICFLAQAFMVCNGQEAPLFLNPTFSDNLKHRTDFCPIHSLVESGTVMRRNALKDTNIQPALFRYQLNKETGAIDEINPGIGIKMLDELARRGQFQWRNSYGVIDSPNENQTWGELLMWTVDTYDLMSDWFLRTTERLADGVLFP